MPPTAGHTGVQQPLAAHGGDPEAAPAVCSRTRHAACHAHGLCHLVCRQGATPVLRHMGCTGPGTQASAQASTESSKRWPTVKGQWAGTRKGLPCI